MPLALSAGIAGDAFTAGRLATPTDPFGTKILALIALNAIKPIPIIAPRANRAPKVAPKSFVEFRIRRESFGWAFMSMADGRRSSLFMEVRRRYTTSCGGQ